MSYQPLKGCWLPASATGLNPHPERSFPSAETFLRATSGRRVTEISVSAGVTSGCPIPTQIQNGKEGHINFVRFHPTAEACRISRSHVKEGNYSDATFSNGLSQKRVWRRETPAFTKGFHIHWTYSAGLRGRLHPTLRKMRAGFSGETLINLSHCKDT